MPESTATDGSPLLTHHGRCHCGAVRFRVAAPASVRVQDCNCALCRKCGYLHLIVPATRFTLDTGADDLVTYQFNTLVARHTFCRHCGVKPFYVPRSNPDGYSVNLRCLATDTLTEVYVEPFDGRDWERHAGGLAALSQD